jgi:hypothetical protein
MEAIRFSETVVTRYKTTQRHNPEDNNRQLVSQLLFTCTESRIRVVSTPATSSEGPGFKSGPKDRIAGA